AVHDDIERFRELSAQVIAVSADPPESTRDRFQQFGEFAFSVLFDPGNAVGSLYGIFEAGSANAAELLQHGTFVIGRDGKVYWAQYGKEPFTDNRTLLYELAHLEGRLPPGSWR